MDKALADNSVEKGLCLIATLFFAIFVMWGFLVHDVATGWAHIYAGVICYLFFVWVLFGFGPGRASGTVLLCLFAVLFPVVMVVIDADLMDQVMTIVGTWLGTAPETPAFSPANS